MHFRRSIMLACHLVCHVGLVLDPVFGLMVRGVLECMPYCVLNEFLVFRRRLGFVSQSHAIAYG